MLCPRAGPSLQAQELRMQVCPKAGLPPQTQEPRLQFYQGLNRCASFPLLSALHFLFSIWTDIKRSVKIAVAPTWRWGEWIWLTGPSKLHRNSLQGLDTSSIRVFDQIRIPEVPITLCPSIYSRKYWIFTGYLRKLWLRFNTGIFFIHDLNK